MKKILALFLCVLLCASLSPAAFAASSRDVSSEASLAQQLNALGLFQGTGKNEDGTTDFELDRAPSRVEALVMLVRALGKGAEAEAYPKTHPFSDVPAWADGYVSYAYDHALANGVSDTLFGAEDAASAEIYLTFMLRALGYSDGDGGDFTWDAPWALASWCGILPTQVDKTDFLRADAVDVIGAALYAYLKGSQTALYEYLASEGVFALEQFDAVFSADPFGAFRQLDGRVSAAIAAKQPLGMLEDNVYASQCHIIVDVTTDGGTVTVTALVGIGNADIQKDNTIGGYGAGIGPWRIQLDAETLECTSCLTAQELAAQGLSWADCLPENALAMQDALTNGMAGVCRLITQQKLDSGEIIYRQPTYAQSLAKVNTELSQVTQTLEAAPCTILLGWLNGTPHGSYAYLYLIYKPGSAVGEGEIVSLPMPRENGWGLTSEPDELYLSEDGLTLYYSRHYDDRLAYVETEDGVDREVVIHEAGTYSYTVDLNTGLTSLEIISD